jgi:hypothetical protein
VARLYDSTMDDEGADSTMDDEDAPGRIPWEYATRLTARPLPLRQWMPPSVVGGYWKVVVEGLRDGRDDHNVGFTFIVPGRNRLTTRWESPYRIQHLTRALRQEGVEFVFGPRWWKNPDGSWAAAVVPSGEPAC